MRNETGWLPFRWHLLVCWWHQLPIRYTIKEDHERIILKRTIPNMVLHAVPKLLALLALGYLLYSLYYFWAFFAVSIAIIGYRLIALFHYRLIFNKTKKVFYKREFLTAHYTLNNAFKLKPSAYGGFIGRYDGRWLFFIQKDTAAGQRIKEYLESNHIEIDWL